MAYTTIDNPELYFQVKLYTGNGSDGNAITLDGDENMQPDFLWIKERSTTNSHRVYDSVRGVNSALLANGTAAEDQYAAYGQLESFDSDGFTVGAGTSNGAGTNASSATIVAWCWKAGTSFTNDASATSVGNTDSNGSASSTAGFSIAKWVGAGASLDIQVKHGLSVKPAVMFTKNIEEAGGNHWAVYHHKNTSAPETDYLKLSDSATTTDESTIWADTEPTSAVFTGGDHSGSNRAGDDFVGYFWNEVQGFSKMGSYTGNGNADGSFIYTGFRPAFILLKNTTTSSRDWMMYDSKRQGYNGANNYLVANTSGSDQTGIEIDILSNGFKARSSATGLNASGVVHVYMAFAEAPFVNSNGVPTNAR